MDKHFEVDPEGKRLPIKLDSTSNGEFLPVPLSPTHRNANRLARRVGYRFLREPGISRCSCPSFPRRATPSRSPSRPPMRCYRPRTRREFLLASSSQMTQAQ
jgi:hypothetical protein